MSINRSIASLAIVAGAVAVGVGAGGASASAGDAPILDRLCVAKGGTAYVTPYTKARCQNAKPAGGEQGLVAERIICTFVYGGEFHSAPSYGAPPGDITWICI